MKKLLILSLLAGKAALAHSSGDVFVPGKGNYVLSGQYEYTLGKSDRHGHADGGGILNDGSYTKNHYYYLSNVLGITDTMAVGLDAQYARTQFKAAGAFPSGGYMNTHDRATYVELFHIWAQQRGDVAFAVKNSITDVAYSSYNPDLFYKMYKIGLFAKHTHDHGIYKSFGVGASFARKFGGQTAIADGKEALTLQAELELNVYENLNFVSNVQFEFEYAKDNSHNHGGNNSNFAHSAMYTGFEYEFKNDFAVSLLWRQDFSGNESRNEHGFAIGFKKQFAL